LLVTSSFSHRNMPKATLLPLKDNKFIYRYVGTHSAFEL
jgi:hypothetical protein